MDKNFLVIGGDLRIVKLVKMLSNKSIVYTYGLEKAKEIDENQNIIKCKKIDEEVLENNNVVIGPIPFSKDGINFFAPYSTADLQINNVMEKIKEKHLIAGNIKDGILKAAKSNNIKITDILQNEKLAILNCISTSEGAIEIAMRETQRIIHGNNVLILGFGRIGKILSKKLQGLSANVTCAARKREDFAWIESYGYNVLNINKLGNELSKFDIIFNTVPHLIITEEKLDYINSECLIIDLASKPGGIDKDAAEKRNIKVIEALALPGKIAPETTAKYIKEAIFEMIEEN